MRYVSAPTRRTRRPARRACAASLAMVVVLPSPGGPKKSRTPGVAAAGAAPSVPASAASSRVPGASRSAVSRRSAAAMTPSTPCATRARCRRRMPRPPGGTCLRHCSSTSSRTTLMSSRTSLTSAPSAGSVAPPAAGSVAPPAGASRSTAAVTVTCPAASVVSRITASGPSVAFTCLSASGMVGAVNRLTFIESHHPERPQPHVRADLAWRDDGEGGKHALDEPPHVPADRRRAEEERREMLSAEALDPLGEPPEEPLREGRLEREERAVVRPLDRIEEQALQVGAERHEREHPVRADEAFRDRAAEGLADVLGERVGVLGPPRVVGERLEDGHQVADRDALAQQVLEDLLDAADGQLLRHQLLDHLGARLRHGVEQLLHLLAPEQLVRVPADHLAQVGDHHRRRLH